VKVLPTLLAIVFLRTSVFVHDPHTSTMLPDLASIALEEEARKIFCNIGNCDERLFNAILDTVLVVFAELWGAWIFLELANAADRLVVIGILFCLNCRVYLDCRLLL